MSRLKVKNWEQFQHYKHRNPPWIKFHKSLLDDHVFHRLPVASKALAPCIWLLASESKDGSVAHDPETIAFRLRMSVKEVEAAIAPLITNGFLIEIGCLLADRKHDASKPLAERLHGATTEKSREEKSRDRAPRLDGFQEFWVSYPRKKSKGDAEKVWNRLSPDGALRGSILEAVERAKASADWQREGGKFIPYPATWLNAKGWEDEADIQQRAKFVI